MAEPQPRELILASASPFRRRMLEAAGVVFRVMPADVDEAALRRHMPPGDLAHVADALAQAKAVAVSQAAPGALVIGADQVLAFGDELLSKPKDLNDARGQLRKLRGKAHHLHAGVALAEAGKVVWAHLETARLVMHAFSDAFLDRYLADMGPAVCRTVGGYEIEGRGIQLFERIEGDLFTIVGLPLLPLLAELRSRGMIAT
jgi:septum formation protein